MKKKIKIFSVAILLPCLLGASVFHQYPILIKWILGKARSIGEPINCVVKLNEKTFKEVKVFRQETTFSGKEKRQYLILFLPNKKKSEGRNVLIIDKDHHLVSKPGSNRRDYEVIRNHLFQSESGSTTMIPFSDDLKGHGFNPNLKIENNRIEFTLPNWSEYKINKIEITEISR